MYWTRFNTIPGELRLLPPRYFFISCFLFAFRLYLLPKNERLETENSKYTKGTGETAGYPSLQLLGGVQNVSFLGCGSLHSLEIRLRIPEPSTRWVPGEEAGQWQSAADLLDAWAAAHKKNLGVWGYTPYNKHRTCTTSIWKGTHIFQASIVGFVIFHFFKGMYIQ